MQGHLENKQEKGRFNFKKKRTSCKLKAKAKGTAKITCTVKRKKKTFKLTCKVKVKAKKTVVTSSLKDTYAKLYRTWVPA